MGGWDGLHVRVVWAVHPERKISFSEYEIHNTSPSDLKEENPPFLWTC